MNYEYIWNQQVKQLMADAHAPERPQRPAQTRIDFQTEPSAIDVEAQHRRRHRTLLLDVDEKGALFEAMS